MGDDEKTAEQLVRELNELRARNRDLVRAHARLEADLQALRESLARYEAESDQKFRGLVQSANSVILRMDTKARVTFFNDYAERFFGYSEKEMLGKSVVGTIVPPEDSSGRDLASTLRDIARHPDQYVTNENENIRRNGERVWVAWTNKGILDDQGNITEVLCVGNDITERKRAEDELRKSEEKYRTIIESIEEGYYEVNLKGDITFFNEPLCEVTGFPKDEILGINYRLFMDEENAKRAFQAYNEVFRTGKPRKLFDYVVLRRDGSTRIVEISISLIRDEQGSPTGFRGILRDVTETRRAELDLKYEKDRFRSLAERAPLGIAMIGSHGDYQYLNPRFTEIFGYDASDIPTGREWFRLAYPDPDCRKKAIARWKQLATGEVSDGIDPPVYRIRCKDGTEKTIQFRAVRLKSGDYVMTCEDISDLKRAEADLSRELNKFRMLYNLAVAMTADQSLDEKLGLVVEECRRVLGTDTSHIALLDEASGDVYMHAFSGIRTEAFKQMRIPMGQGLGGMVAKTGRGYIVEDYFKEIGPLMHDVVHEEGLVSGIAAPIQMGRTNLGVLYVCNREKTSFTQSDLETLSLMGNLVAVEITRTRAEERLRDSEERYRSVMEAAPDPVVVYDFQGKVTYVNRAFVKVFGWTLDELRGKRLDFVPEENRPETVDAIKRVLAGETILLETRRKTKDGRLLDIQVNSAVFMGRDGKPAGSVVILRDITLRKKSQEELRKARDELEMRVAERTAELNEAVQALNRENEERIKAEQDLLASRQMLDNILNASPVAIVYYEHQKLKWMNEATAAMFGPQKYIDRHPSEFYGSREEYLRVTEFFHDAVKEGEPMETEAQLMRADGSVFPGLLRMSALDVTDPKRANIATVVDLSEKKLAEQKQRESEDRYRSLVEESFDGIMIQDGSRIVFANTRLHEMLGYDNGALLGMRFWRVFHPDYHDLVRQRCHARFCGEDVPSQYEVQLFRKDGSSFDGELNARVIRVGEQALIQVWIRDISQRKQAERELRESRQTLTTILAASPVGIARASKKKLDWANRAFAEMFGFEDESECLGQSTETLYPSRHEFKLTGKFLYDLLERQRQAETDCTFVRKDGTTFQGHITIAPTDPSDPTGEVIAAITDISERKRAEKALQQSEETARALLNATTEAALLTDVSGTVLASNEVAALLFRSSPDNLVGRRLVDLLPGDLAETRTQRSREVIQTGIPTRFVDIQNERYLDHCIYPVFNALGRVERLAIFARDITEQKQAEEALRASEEKSRRLYEETRRREELYRSLLNSSPDAVVIYDMEGRAQYVNPSFTNIFGWEMEDVRDKPIDYVPESEKHETERVIQEKILQGIPVSGWETRRFTKDGRTLYISLSSSRYHDHENKPAGILMVLRDISERKKAERELELALETARQLRHQAETANRAKSDFVANMSHEIRTPMNAIIGLTDLSLRCYVSSKVRDYLTKIRVSSQSLLGIINDILDFSKIEAGKLDLESVDFDLRDVVGNLADLMGTGPSSKGVEFLVSLASDVPCVLKGDPLRLGQVLTNLANNAVKFTHEGEIIVKVTLVEKNEQQAKIAFAVEDTGIGIPRELLPALFDSFTQADGSTTRRFGGSGLGLTICKRLVQMMGGEIRVQSQPGKGSTFSFCLEFQRVPEKDTGRFVLSQEMVGLKVLVVDDNAMARDVLVDMLKSFSFKAQAVESGYEALRELEAEAHTRPYDLVLMDWNMPGMDGIETSRRIDTDLRLGVKIPKIIMVTAFRREEVMAQAEEAGLVGFLVKPVHQSVLFDTIIDVFCKEPGRIPGAHVPEKWEPKSRMLLQGARVLVVEDNEINQQVAREILEKAGAIVEIAANGHQAVEAVTRREFDAVLMDLQIPEMDGYEATRTIRSDERFKDLPIIAMTAHAMKGDRERCLEAGMNDHVTKPVDIDELRHIVAQWVRRGHRENVQSQEPPQPVGPPHPEFLETGLSTLPPHLPGINVQSALKRLEGDAELLVKLLDTFAQEFRDASRQIKQAREKGENELAQRLAHSAKGVAGNVGADELYAAAVELERAFKEENEDASGEMLMRFDEALTTLLQSVSLIKQPIAGTRAPKPPPADEPVADLHPLKPSLKELDDLIQEHNVRALECFDSVKTELRKAGIQDEVEKLEDSLTFFDFKTARTVLSEILQILNLSIEGEGA